MKRKYRPSNGIESMCFMENFCEQCIHEKWSHTQDDNDKKCEILSRTMIFDIDEPEYPSEWTYDENGPTCTKFQKWDWGNDGDPDDPDNPKATPPTPDPKQIDMFPLYPDEKTFEKLEHDYSEDELYL